MLELLVGVLVGAFALLAAEAVAVFVFLSRVLRKKKHDPTEARSVDQGEETLFGCDYSKKGIVWLLDPEKIPKGSDELKSKRRIVEVFPSRKYAKIIDHSLSIMDVDGRQEEATVQLRECTVLSVSGSDQPSKKWAKKYPIRVEGKGPSIYNGSQVFYVFLETSMEKESWCKALRRASCEDTEKHYAKLRKDFSDYVVPLQSSENPLPLKPCENFADVVEKTLRVDSPSKVRQLFKKMAKKASKSVSKVGETSSSEKSSNCSPESSAKFISPLLDQSRSQSHVSSDEASITDDGRGCWNLLFSRLFFDAQRSSRVNDYIKGRIQKSLSSMKTPNYIGGITCTSIHLGNLPPFICCMRVLPMDEHLEWAFEADIEYHGGISFEIETRLDVGESDFPVGLLDSKNSASEVTSALLGDLEEHDEFLNLARDSPEKKSDENRPDSMGRSKSTSWASRYKSLVNSIAAHVSQVPLSLSLKISSLRGTLRVMIKAPPADQLWFGFTSSPELEWSIDASVGDIKLGSGQVTSLLGNRIKTTIQDTLVLPNCESVSISWMLAEKDDWVPRQVAPFIWSSQRPESAGGAVADAAPPLASLVRRDSPVDSVAPPPNRRDSPADTAATPLEQGDSSADKLPPRPHVRRHGPENTAAPPIDRRDTPLSYPRSFSVESTLDNFPADDGSRPPPATSPARTSRKAWMLDMGRKVSERVEEKRRHIEEKGRLMVVKMRENVDKRS